MADVMTPYALMYQTVFFGNQQVAKKEDLLVQLKPFFYKETVKKPETPIVNTTRVLPKIVPSVFEPLPPPPPKPTKNTLFWCLYHAHNGPLLYSEKYDINMELQERHKMADHFRENNRVLKDRRHRMTNADVDEIMSNLLTISSRKTFWSTCFGELTTDISQAIVFSRYYKTNIIICIQERRVAVSFVYEEQAKTITLLLTPENGLYEITENPETATGYLMMETMRTSLKPLSQYKMGDLAEMGQKLGLLALPKKKAELYQTIVDHCQGKRVNDDVSF